MRFNVLCVTFKVKLNTEFYFDDWRSISAFLRDKLIIMVTYFEWTWQKCLINFGVIEFQPIIKGSQKSRKCGNNLKNSKWNLANNLIPIFDELPCYRILESFVQRQTVRRFLFHLHFRRFLFLLGKPFLEVSWLLELHGLLQRSNSDSLHSQKSNHFPLSLALLLLHPLMNFLLRFKHSLFCQIALHFYFSLKSFMCQSLSFLITCAKSLRIIIDEANVSEFCIILHHRLQPLIVRFFPFPNSFRW